MGPIEDEGAELLTSIGRYITENTGDQKKVRFCFNASQSLSRDHTEPSLEHLSQQRDRRSDTSGR